jgi:chemotaxis protein histidine kinase CheA
MGDATKNSKALSRKLFENAVDDAQFLVAYAAGKCRKDIEEPMLNTLIQAKRYVDQQKEVNAAFEADFWLAYQQIWNLVKPVTAESVKANLSLEPRFISKILATIDPAPDWVSKNIPGLFKWAKNRTTSKARRTVDRFIFFTVLVLIVVLFLQIYWVIGNQLTAHLAELLTKETELSQEIDANRDEYSALEMRFKQDEWESESFKTNGVYTFYSTPDWERDILDNLSEKAKLESDLAAIKSQLERNSAVLMIWSNPWKRLIVNSVNGTHLEDVNQYDSQIASIKRQIRALNDQLVADPDGSKKIGEARDQVELLQKQLTELQKNQATDSDEILSLRSKLDNLTNWVNQPGLANQIVSQLNQDIERLKEEKTTLRRQKQADFKRETSRQAQLAAQFVLAILQSYLLPLFYGILGAGTFVLRSLSKEIEDETFSDDKGIQHLLRVSLGALAGILVGWFSFLIPSETTTFVGSISPLAIAFLVGYNIEVFFSLMDRALFSITERLQRPAPASQQETDSNQASNNASTESGKPKTAGIQAPALGEAAD